MLTLNIPDKPWLKHAYNWGDCRACPIGKSCFKHVLGRGTLPANIVFIGEAPGPLENTLGYPFVGPAGKVLDKLIAAVQDELTPTLRKRFTYAITNCIACFPDDGTGSFRQPYPEEIHNCSDRVVEFLSLAKPKGVILLGKVAEKNAPTSDEWATLAVYHPSFLLRKGGASPRNLDFTRTKLKVVKFLTEVLTQPRGSR